MKKVIYLISILFAVALMSFSCEDPIVPETTIEDFIGTWETISYEYQNELYLTCEELEEANISPDGVEFAFLELTINSASHAILNDICGENTESDNVMFDNNYLIFNDGSFLILKFKVLNFENDMLELELYEKNIGTLGDVLLHGKYVLQR
jgi:hypothetical protein